MQVANIFKEAKDLIEPSKPTFARVAGYSLLTVCTKYGSSTDPERSAYFSVLTSSTSDEDFGLQLAALIELSKSGRDVAGFHYAIIPLLTAWLRQAFILTTAARKAAARQNRASKNKVILPEEKNIALLFNFVSDVIKFNFNITSEDSIGDLIDGILSICISTPLSGDLKACISVLDTIVTYGEIPSSKLNECVTVLCSIYCIVEAVQSEAWRSIRNLCKSHNGQTTTRILLEILRQPKVEKGEKQNMREIRGALAVLEKLFAKDGENGYPNIPFTILTEGLATIITVEHGNIEPDVLQLILSLFHDDGSGVKTNLLEEDWTGVFKVATSCATRALETQDGRPITNRSRGTTKMKDIMSKDEMDSNVATATAQTLYMLILRIEELLVTPPSPDFFQRTECIEFFVSVHAHLPDSCAKIVIDHYMDQRACYPSHLDWRENIQLILEAFFADRSQPAYIRLHALKAVTDVFEMIDCMDQARDPDAIQALITGILEDVGEERDIAVLQEIMGFSVAVAVKTDEVMFDWILSSTRACVFNSDQLQSPIGAQSTTRPGLGASRLSSTNSKSIAPTPSNVVTQGLVQIFMETMVTAADKADRIFNELLLIIKSHECETDARLSALRLLLHLRADWTNRIFLTSDTEAEGLAACLFRTSASIAQRQSRDEANNIQRVSKGDDGPGRLARSTSLGQGQNLKSAAKIGNGISRSSQRHQALWVYPDRNDLPIAFDDKASTILASFLAPMDASLLKESNKMVLNMSEYLTTLINLLENGCDWEVYSYILVHLSSQLTNHALFKGATPSINNLRAVLCEQIRIGAAHEPPVSSGLRKADVVICLLQVLTTVVSYHQCFAKVEEDELVRTFMQGMGSEKVAKCCIHALAICCHELPTSMSKTLVTILQKMAQIITQTHVAVHVLEFLTCLSRMPELYVNFRDEEYRTVLAISFRYLQYVRDQNAREQGNRNAYPHVKSPSALDSSRGIIDRNPPESNYQPNDSDDIPQYVFALAYQSIIFWFLNIKLPDRAPLVSWIAKNLITTDSSGRERIDEQSQVILDFMQRVAFADVDESVSDVNFNSDRYGKIARKRWIVGHGIITVEQATRGGWTQITKRQPSATSRYVIRQRFPKLPPHQVQTSNQDRRGDLWHNDVVLPSYVFLQIGASVPQATEHLRPIALPDDDIMRRAIASFDRNSTVDGHKVGVVYIGENQFNEVEILSNVSGSSDYNEFLEGLGFLTRLKGAEFNTQGLDREYDTDGEFTYCWRDRVTEVVFHVTTQMPTNLENDPQCISKKRHIGNDFVNIIFNNSGSAFKFDTFPSEFNYVNIVIAPESRISFVARHARPESNKQYSFYKVKVMSKPGFPEISPAAETKIVSLAALPSYVRLLALNACMFSLVWASREGADHVSPWRNRLREIKRLRDKYGIKTMSCTPVSPPGSSNGISHTQRHVGDTLHSLTSVRRSSVANLQLQFLTNSESGSARSSMLSTAETEVGSGGDESLMEGFDFSKWA